MGKQVDYSYVAESYQPPEEQKIDLGPYPSPIAPVDFSQMALHKPVNPYD